MYLPIRTGYGVRRQQGDCPVSISYSITPRLYTSLFASTCSILPIAAAVVGGPGSLAGATLGAFILVPLSEVLRGVGGLRIVFYGVFLVVFIVALPEGIFHFIQRKYNQFERWVEVDS